MKKTNPALLRVYLIYSLVVVAMIVVIVKSFMIVHDGREHVFKLSGSNLEQRPAMISPRRGEILDADMNPLVTSVSTYDIYIDPVTVKDELWNEEIGNLSVGLAGLFKDKTAREYEEYLRDARSKRNRYVLIRKRATHEERTKVRALPIFNQGRFKGGLIDNNITTVRKRPNDELLARTLGYVKVTDRDTIYLGVEGSYDKYLAGQEGIVLEQKIGNSWKRTGSVVREAVNGYDIVTSIDKDIQEVAHTELERQLKSKGGRYGTAVVMDVKTGFIKAIVNLEENGRGGYGESYNHAIGTREVPGSTLKLASLMAALEDEKIKLTDTVNAVGKYTFYNKSLNDATRYGYGKISVKEAFEVSSNVISKIIFDGYRNEPQKFLDRLEQFGLTEKTGINIQGEISPDYSQPGTSRWWGGSLAWMAIGYEFSLTPLELLAFYNAVANDGKYMQPQIISHVVDNGRVVEEFMPVVKRERICSQETIDLMKEALEGVVTQGTGRQLKSAYFDIAGKTGTAMIANNNEGYGPKGEHKYIASFVGYFPADDPIYSCIISIAAPTNDIYGSSVSGTVFAAIANKVYASSYKYHDAVNEKTQMASLPYVLNGSRYDINTVLNYFKIQKDLSGNNDWIRTGVANGKVSYADLKIEKGKVPNVIGMGLTDAVYLLEKNGMVVHTSGYGKVVSQSLPSGKPSAAGELIELILK